MEPELITHNIEMSPSIELLATALSAFQGEVEAVKKDAENPFFRSKYASLAGIMETIRKPLSVNGLSITQFPLPNGQLTSLLLHKSGQYIKSTYEMKSADTKPQAIGSLITYMRRYAISAILGIATEDDDDGNVASGTAPKVFTPKKSDTNPHLKKFEDELDKDL